MYKTYIYTLCGSGAREERVGGARRDLGRGAPVGRRKRHVTADPRRVSTRRGECSQGYSGVLTAVLSGLSTAIELARAAALRVPRDRN